MSVAPQRQRWAKSALIVPAFSARLPRPWLEVDDYDALIANCQRLDHGSLDDIED